MTFSVNQSNIISVNLLAIIVVSFALVGWSSVAGGVYESPLNNFLEILFLCNLGITSAAVLFDKEHNTVAVYISTSVTFTVFIGIILYHAQRQLLATKLGSELKKKVFDLKRRNVESTNKVRRLQSSNQNQSGVSCTVVELKEPLLEDELELTT